MKPSLHPRPTGPLSGTPSQIPPNAGPVTEQINKVAGKLVDFMRNSLEDIFKELAAHGSPEAMIKALQVFAFKQCFKIDVVLKKITPHDYHDG